MPLILKLIYIVLFGFINFELHRILVRKERGRNIFYLALFGIVGMIFHLTAPDNWSILSIKYFYRFLVFSFSLVILKIGSHKQSELLAKQLSERNEGMKMPLWFKRIVTFVADYGIYFMIFIYQVTFIVVDSLRV